MLHPAALLFFAKVDVKFSVQFFFFLVLPAVADLAQVCVKREGEGGGGVERQLQVLREGHGRRREVALPKGETVTLGWREHVEHHLLLSEMEPTLFVT